MNTDIPDEDGWYSETDIMLGRLSALNVRIEMPIPMGPLWDDVEVLANVVEDLVKLVAQRPRMATTEPLTDAMIGSVRWSEVAEKGDLCTIYDAEIALFSEIPSDKARARLKCCQVINDARAMDKSKPFVRVIP